jgi:flagellar assembly protein FliH
MESRLAVAEREAYQRGLAEGEAKARAVEERFAALHQKLAETITQLGSYKAGLRAAAEKDLVELALAIARRVLHREVHVDPHALEGIIGAALERVNAQEVVAVKTHPFHAEALRGALARMAPGNRISVHGDPALPVGSVILEMPRGNLDASVDSQLEEIERGLADRLGRTA